MKRSGNANGVTLVELLAAMSVLAVMLVIFTQIIGLVWNTWKDGKSRVDNFAQARTALGLLDRDIQSMVLRPDVAAFVDGDAKPACAFYTRFPGSESGRNRRVSLVQYLLVTDLSGKPRLARKDFGLDYGTTETQRRGISFNEISKLPDLADSPNVMQQDVAEGVIAFRFQFVDGNGNLGDHFVFDRRQPAATSNTRAITASLVVLDGESYRTMEVAGKLPGILAGLSGTPPPNETYAKYWRGSLPDLLAPLPPLLRASLRVFERSIYIPVEAVQG